MDVCEIQTSFFLVGWEIKFIGRPPMRDKGEGFRS